MGVKFDMRLQRAHLIEPKAASWALVKFLFAAHDVPLHVHEVSVYARGARLTICRRHKLNDLKAVGALQTVAFFVAIVVMINHVLMA